MSYFESQGVTLRGPGAWKTGRCEFHGGGDSLRVNAKSGGWRCMNCGESGGDVLAYHIKRHCLDFVAAARALGAYEEDGKPHTGSAPTLPLGPRDAMGLVAFELTVAFVVMSDVFRGKRPSPEDWSRFTDCARRLTVLCEEYRA